ncbi:siderophore-iron reductase FhuF [Rhizobium alvei]|uniref:Siderophore-iron reductase FhuF n=1 Tax=Rhizobium alvei TaxID=1132659 RepID=A0ABT8YU48_9HYPH|nr:siderophore-iron reductase FhuF [Rhizobium alvei]MDO6966700.1 siderophore-iron reductase FhuF [Rhizobium alvei]
MEIQEQTIEREAEAGPSKDGSASADFADLIIAATGDKYVYCKDSLRLSPPEGLETIACRDLTDATVFNSVIDRFARTHGQKADRRAIVSLWTLYYFSTLAIATTVLNLEVGRRVPIGIDRARLAIDPETGTPRAFILPHLGEPAPASDTIERFLTPLLREHLEPQIEAIVGLSGVGRKLLWNNVAAYLDWIMDQIRNTSGRPAAVALARSYRETSRLGDWKNPVHGMIRPECDANGQPYGRRKVCCLRYAIDGIGGCGISCPLPQGRGEN